MEQWTNPNSMGRHLSVLLTVALSSIGAADELRAQRHELELDGRTLELEEVYYEDFAHGADDWLIEGSAKIGTESGRLQVDAREGAVTLWCRRAFSGAQLVEYDVRLMSDSLESNINMFLLAGSPDAAGLLTTTGERNGDYGLYHVFPNYLVTVLNATSPERRVRLRVRMRLNPGFELVQENWLDPLVFGKVYHVAYLMEPPRVTVLLDDRVIGSADYGARRSSGLHGLRIWRTHSIYDNFRVSRLTGN